MTDAAFQDWIADARRADIMVAAEARGAELKRSGIEVVGPCPVCGGTDRFAINLRKRVFHCRGCDAGGDVIALVQHLDACDFRAACAALTGRPAPSGGSGQVDEAERARREHERRREEEARARGEVDWRERERRKAHGLWRAAVRPEGTATERYLAGRGITLPERAPIRHQEALPFWLPPDKPAGRDKPVEIWRGPAMLAAITDDLGVFSGVHCTWLDPERPGEKAEIVHPDTGELLPAKKVRGSKRRAAIELVDRAGDEPRKLYIGEGIETVLSVWTALTVAGRDLSGAIFWSAIDLGHLGGRAAETVPHPELTRTDLLGRVRKVRVPGPAPALEPDKDLMPPASVAEVVLLGDGDSDRFTTEHALRRAASRWRAPGRTVRAAWPGAGVDFNDVLRGRAA